ncbi:MAG: GNAT family N-acetyltransferase [Acidimicrobiia bacterium]|jgi:mycothiol synthase
MLTDLQPVRFDPASLDDADLEALNDHLNRIRIEHDPDFPPRPLQETRAAFTSRPDFVIPAAWWIREGNGRVVAAGFVDAFELENNRHVVEVEIGVDAGRRRRGLGRALLRAVAGRAAELDRRLLIGDTDSSIPAGDAFARTVGAESGLATLTNQVLLAELDLDLLRSWREHGEATATDFELAWYDGPYPDEAVGTMVEIVGVMNDQPRGDLDVGDFEFTAHDLRQLEMELTARGIERWTVAAIHRPSGRAAGFSQVYWNPTIPHLVQQGDTGVLPEFRGHRLGKWMKAAMAERILRDRPGATCIRTGNAGSNAPMLAINHEMGFREYRRHTIWQVAIDAVLA